MASFYSGPLIGRQRVSGGRGAGCHVLCLMLCVVLKLVGDRGPRGVSPAPSDRSVTGDTGESGLLIVSLRQGCIQVGRIHRRGGAEEGSWV